MPVNVFSRYNNSHSETICVKSHIVWSNRTHFHPSLVPVCARKHSTLSSKWTVDTCNNKAHQAFQLVSRSQILAADEPTTGYRKCIYTGQLTKVYSPATLWPSAIQYGGVLANKTRTVYSHTICNMRGVQTSNGQHKMHTTSILPDDNQYRRLLTTVNMEDVPTTVKTECVLTD